MRFKYRKILDDLVGIGIISFSLLLFISLLSKNPLSAETNLAGSIGALLCKLIFLPFGWSAILVALLLLVLGIKKLLNLEFNWILSLVGGLILVVSSAILNYLLFAISDYNFVGKVLSSFLLDKVKFATYLITFIGVITGLSLFLETSPLAMVNFIKKIPKAFFRREKDKIKMKIDRKKEIIPTEKKYNLPNAYLLKDHPKLPKGKKFIDDGLDNKARLIEEVLSDFGVHARVENITKGPTVSTFELSLKKGTKISSIMNLVDDIALALAVPAVRIHAPLPHKSLLGIEVPNRKKEVISLKEVILSDEFIKTAADLPIGLGVDMEGRAAIIDLASLPHLLIAGATGSGKTICIHSIIMSLLFKKTPDELRFILIDPKMVELPIYNGIGHLAGEVITKTKQAVLVLSNLQKIMEKRYELFAECDTLTKPRDIQSYNKIAKRPLPYIVVVIDELADIMLTSMRECEEAIVRIAQLGRACGLHLVVATQRPSVDIITGTIKANILARVALSVASKVDSRIILDHIGAEKLLGKGDMLYLSPTQPRPMRLQGSFVSTQEVEAVVRFIRLQNIKPQESEDYSLLYQKSQEVNSDDELYSLAVKIARENKDKLSISFLQRQLHIGYNRAARIYERLQINKII